MLLQHLLRRAPAAACTVLTASYAQHAYTQQGPCDDGLEEDDDAGFDGPRRHTLADPNRYDSIVIGCGVSGTAAVEEVAKRAPRGHRCLVLESDAFAVRRCEALAAEVGYDTIDCIRARAESLNPLLRQVRTTEGDEFFYGRNCLISTGAAAAVPPPGFVDEKCFASVRCIGHGEAADAAAVRDAFSVAKRGGRVCVVGGSWQAVALAAAVARAAPAETAADSATLVFPEPTPIGARLPKDLGKKLRKRLEKRGVNVIALHQIRYVGPADDNKKASHAVYLARADDAMKTSQCRADLVVVAGGEHVQQVQVSARDARSAPRGSTALEVVKATRLDDATQRRPIFVNEELSAGGSVLACGDAAATPCRLETTTSALVNTTTHGQRGAVIAVETGTPHAVGTGKAAGAVLATGDGSSAAKVLAGLTPTLAADMRSTLGWHVGFVGKCDAALEAHVFASKSIDVAIYVEKTDLSGGGSFRRIPMGVVVVAKNRELDAAQAADSAAVGLRAHLTAPPPDEHPDETYRNDVDFLRGLAAAVAAAAGTDDFSLKHSQIISRADRLGPRYWDGQGAADTALFSRGGRTEMRAKRVAGAFQMQVRKGAVQELDDRRKAAAAVEAGMERLVSAAKEAAGGDS